MNNHDEAKNNALIALNIRQSIYDFNHPDLAEPLILLARIALVENKFEEAERYSIDALNIYQNTFPENHWLVADAEGQLGLCRALSGDYAEAEPVVLASYETIQTHRGVKGRRTRDSLERVIRFYELWDRPEQASAHRARLEAINER